MLRKHYLNKILPVLILFLILVVSTRFLNNIIFIPVDLRYMCLQLCHKIFRPEENMNIFPQSKEITKSNI